MSVKTICPDEFVTGNAAIDEEHRQLRLLLAEVQGICAEYDRKDTCAGCSEGKVANCERQLIACLTEILGFMIEHFRGEECILKARCQTEVEKGHFAQHVEAHVDLIERAATVTTLDDLERTVRHIADAVAILDHWLTDHIERFDVPMLRESRAPG
jgi:hemerythrin